MLSQIGQLGRDRAGRSRAGVAEAAPGTPRRAARPSGRRRTRAAAALAAALAVASITAACGSGSSSSSSPSGSSSSGSSSSGSAASSGADVAAAKAAIAPFIGKPSAFPVTEPLRSPLPPGKKFAYLQCATPFCALAGRSLQAAVTAIGGTFSSVNSGATAQTSQAAASSLLATKPDVVFLTIDPSLFGDSLKQLSSAGVKVVSISIAKDVKPFGISFNYLGKDEVQEDGRLLADFVVANIGPGTKAVFYGLPTFDFSLPVQEAFMSELKVKCPSCSARAVPIDTATIGTTSATKVVADLQAHPDTKAAVFVSLQIAQGLPAAMRAAGLSGVATVGRAATPGNLADIKSGGLTASLAIDTPVSTWTAVDAGARLLLGQQPTAVEQAGQLPKRFLQKADITFNVANGWTGYPDYPQRFAKLWHPAG